MAASCALVPTVPVKNLQINFVNSAGKAENIFTFHGSVAENQMKDQFYQHLVKKNITEETSRSSSEMRIGYTLTKHETGINVNIGVRVTDDMLYYLSKEIARPNNKVPWALQYEESQIYRNIINQKYTQVIDGQKLSTKMVVYKHYKKEIDALIAMEMAEFDSFVRPYFVNILATLNFIDDMVPHYPYFVFNVAVPRTDRDVAQILAPYTEPKIHTDTTFRTILTFVKSPVSTEIMFSNKSKNKEFNAIVPVAEDDQFNSCPLFRFKTSESEVMTLCFNDDLILHTVPFFDKNAGVVTDRDGDGPAAKRKKYQPRYNSVRQYPTKSIPLPVYRNPQLERGERHIFVTFLCDENFNRKDRVVDAYNFSNNYIVHIPFSEIDEYRQAPGHVIKIKTQEDMEQLIDHINTKEYLGPAQITGGFTRRLMRRRRTRKKKRSIKRCRKTRRSY